MLRQCKLKTYYRMFMVVYIKHNLDVFRTPYSIIEIKCVYAYVKEIVSANSIVP